MKKFKKLIVAAGLMLSISAFTLTNQTEAAMNHIVQSGDTYWEIAKEFGIPIDSLMTANNSKTLMAGQNMILPYAKITPADKDLMARLVRAEAVGEPYAGKVAVAVVIMNRIKSNKFPNTVKSVIYQVTNGHYAFTPVKNGQIKQPATLASKKAVNEAIALSGKGSGSLFFYNPRIITNSWILSRPVTVTIGKHRFAR